MDVADRNSNLQLHHTTWNQEKHCFLLPCWILWNLIMSALPWQSQTIVVTIQLFLSECLRSLNFWLDKSMVHRPHHKGINWRRGMSHATNTLLLDAPLLHLGKALVTQGSFNRACLFLESMTGEKTLCWLRTAHPLEKFRRVIASFKLY